MFRWLLPPDKSLTKCSVGQLFSIEQVLCGIEESARLGVLGYPLHTRHSLTDTV